MMQVESNEFGGLDELNTKMLLIDLELYQGALSKCNMTIQKYNEGIK